MEELILQGLEKMDQDLERIEKLMIQNTLKIEKIIGVMLEIRQDARDIIKNPLLKRGGRGS